MLAQPGAELALGRQLVKLPRLSEGLFGRGEAGEEAVGSLFEVEALRDSVFQEGELAQRRREDGEEAHRERQLPPLVLDARLPVDVARRPQVAHRPHAWCFEHDVVEVGQVEDGRLLPFEVDCVDEAVAFRVEQRSALEDFLGRAALFEQFLQGIEGDDRRKEGLEPDEHLRQHGLRFERRVDFDGGAEADLLLLQEADFDEVLAEVAQRVEARAGVVEDPVEGAVAFGVAAAGAVLRADGLGLQPDAPQAVEGEALFEELVVCSRFQHRRGRVGQAAVGLGVAGNVERRLRVGHRFEPRVSDAGDVEQDFAPVGNGHGVAAEDLLCREKTGGCRLRPGGGVGREDVSDVVGGAVAEVEEGENQGLEDGDAGVVGVVVCPKVAAELAEMGQPLVAQAAEVEPVREAGVVSADGGCFGHGALWADLRSFGSVKNPGAGVVGEDANNGQRAGGVRRRSRPSSHRRRLRSSLSNPRSAAAAP